MRDGEFPSLTPRELPGAGQALYGANWREELARALGLASVHDIRAVETGQTPAPPEWRARLIALAQDAALRAMDVASTLIWREAGGKDAAPPAFEAPRLV